ncbi:MAG: tetratricopeptide repeat protein [Desulfobacterales bacterium]|nr:tetratricopeptide repeat protein [Desulfobacterales bacterium]
MSEKRIFIHNHYLYELILLLAIFIAYSQVRTYPFVLYDDQAYIVNKFRIQTGLSWNNLIWALRSTEEGNWHPLTWMSHMLDCQLFGLNAGGHHLMNLLIHILNTLILFHALFKMSREYWPSILATAFFALHPVNVETVVQIAQRKNLLCSFFLALSLYSYAYYVDKETLSRYIWLIIAYSLGLMSKPMIVTLPFLLLLLDIWPLQRINSFSFKKLTIIVLEKIPLMLLSIIASILTYYAQNQAGATKMLGPVSMILKLSNVAMAYWRYLYNLFFPFNLSFFYQYPTHQHIIAVVISVLGLCLISFLAIFYINKIPWLFTGWFWFLGTLIPVIGLVQVGDQHIADRYAYIPFVGTYLIISWFVFSIVKKYKLFSRIISVGCIIILIYFLVLTQKQTTYWSSNELLFTNAIQIDPDNYIAHYNLAVHFQEQHKKEEAKTHYREVIRIKPNHVDSINNLAVLLQEEGKGNEAIELYKRAISIDPKFEMPYLNLANELKKRGEFKEAEILYLKGYILAPNNTDILKTIGNFFMEMNKYKQAMIFFERTFNINPSDIVTIKQIALLLSMMGRFSEAIGQYEHALTIYPNDATIWYNMGIVMETSKRYKEALIYYSKSVELDPNYADANYAMGVQLSRIGKLETALKYFKKSLEITPNNAQLWDDIGKCLLSLGRIDESINAFNHAISIDSQNQDFLHNLEKAKSMTHSLSQ